MSGDEDEGYVLRVRGLPWSATKEEIQKFFADVNIENGTDGIHMTLSREGRPSGEAYVEVETEEDLNKGLDKHNDHMGHRYIEVFKSKKSEMDWVIKRSGAHQQDSLNDGCVRLRGLPFGCSKEEISQFFSETDNKLQISTWKKKVLQPCTVALKFNLYIEIFKSSLQEVRVAVGMSGPKMRPMMSSRPGPYDRNDRFGGIMGRYGMGRGSRNFRGFIDDDGYNDFGGNYGNSYGGFGFGGGGFGGRDNYGSRLDGPMDNGRFGSSFGQGGRPFNTTGHCVHMRGLPFRAIEQDIYDFFRPLNVTPVNVRLRYDNSGRPSGESDVEFASHEDAVKAMSKDKANMQHRYIELFLNSTPSPMGGGGGPGGFGGGGMQGGGGGNMGFGGGMGNQMGGGSGRFGGSSMGSGGGGSGYYGGIGGSGGGYQNHQMSGSSMNSMIGGSNYSAF